MLSQSFNTGWNIKEGFSQPFTNLFSKEQNLGTPVTLPHDAMILEKKTPDTKTENRPVTIPANHISIRSCSMCRMTGWIKILYWNLKGLSQCAGIYQWRFCGQPPFRLFPVHDSG